MAKARIEIDFAHCSAGLRHFVEERTAECVRNGMNVSIRNGRFIRCGTGMAGGTCCEVELRVAYSGPDSIGVMLHEFGHAEQIIRHPKIWGSSFVAGRDAESWVDDWITGKIELTPRRLRRYFLHLLKIESDCERRTWENIGKYNIKELSRSEYALDANCYLEFHAMVMYRHRRWSGSVGYRKNPRNIGRMPQDRIFTPEEIVALMT